MNAIHVHLLLNHIPVLGAVFGLFILLLGMGIKNKTLIYTAWGVFLLVAVVSLPVYFSGEQAEELAEQLPEVVYAHLEAHEHWGTYALLSADLLGGLALVSLIVDLKCKTCGWLRVLVVLMALVTAALMAQTAYSGGLIRHPEIHRSIGTDMNQL